MGKKIKIYQTESYTTYVVREAVTIDLDDYPELEGMSNDEIVDFLEGNSCDMKPQDEDYDCLSDELIEKYVIKEKITEENYSYKVEEE
jgi:hypothetical protein